MFPNAYLVIVCVAMLHMSSPCCASAEEPKPAEAKRTVVTDEAPIAGIGVALRAERGKYFVHKVLPNSSAEASGLLNAGDQILAIGYRNEVPKIVDGLALNEVADMIRGASGTVVRLTVAAGGKTQVISLVRGDVKELNVFGRGEPLAADTVAPVFEFTRTGDGKKLKLSDYAGKIVVIDFWACWCKPCMEQLDGLPKQLEKHPEWRDKVVILAVSVDEELEAPTELVKKRGWKGIEAVWSGQAPLKPYHARALPTLYIINRAGKVADVSSEAGIAEAIEAVLEADKGP